MQRLGLLLAPFQKKKQNLLVQHRSCSLLPLRLKRDETNKFRASSIISGAAIRVRTPGLSHLITGHTRSYMAVWIVAAYCSAKFWALTECLDICLDQGQIFRYESKFWSRILFFRQLLAKLGQQK
jgi:hypothetical protein